jgi:hypothetical protein
MIEIDVVKLDLKGVCVGIKRMTIDEWKLLKKQPNFIYRAYQINYHSFVVGI